MESLEKNLFGLELKINQLNQHMKEIKSLLVEVNSKYFKWIDWIPEKEAQRLLDVKETTLWGMRKRKLVRHTKLGNKVYYSLRSIEILLDKGSSR
jgi:hypothetical protein